MTSDKTAMEDIQFSLELLKSGRIDDAREYLQSINHPKAKEFLDQLDETVVAPKSSDPRKTRSTMSDERRQELTRQRTARQQHQPRATATVIDETHTSIFEAWKRNIQAATHMEAWWAAIGITVAIGFVFLVVSPFTFGLIIIFCAGLVTYLNLGQEITRIDQSTGAVTRFYQFSNWKHYVVTANAPKKVEYVGDALDLNYPASISSFYALTYREDRDVAATIIRSAIISLWARGFIEVHEVQITRSLFEFPFEGSAPIYALTLAPEVTNAEVDGVIETHIVKVIRNYFGQNVPRLFARPWQQGPSPYEVTYAYMGKTHYQASQRVINIVRNDPAIKRIAVSGRDVSGNQRFTVSRDHEEPLRNEGLVVLRLATGQTPETRAFTIALNNGVTAAVRQRTATKNK
jgi:hypothetical protein